MALVAWYKLDGNAKNNTGDSSLDGSIINSPVLENGKFGQSYKFKYNTSDGVSIPSNFAGLSEYSISLWVKPIGTHRSYNGTFISSGNWNGTSWAFGVSQDNTQIDVAGRHYNTWISYTLQLNVWTHLVTVVKNNIATLYANGVLIGSRGVTGLLASDALNTTIGRETYANGYFGFNGNIDDVRIYDRAISGSEIARLAGVQNRMLIGHWPLNGNAEDVSGNNLHGTPVNITYGNGKIGLAGEFNGSNGYIQIASNSIFSHASVSIAGWLKLDSSGSWMMVYKNGTGSYYIYGDSNTWGLWTIYGPTGTRYDANLGSLTIGIWYHIVCIFDSKTGRQATYKNGTLIDEKNGVSHGVGSGDLTIGRYSSSYYTNGQINDVRIYNYALDESEIKKLAQPLVLHYKFDDSREESTENLWVGGFNIYNNYGVPASITQLSETFLGQPIYRLAMTVDDAHSTRLSHFQTSLGGHGVYGGDGEWTENVSFSSSVYWRPVNKLDVVVGGTASNTTGWSSGGNTDVGGGWRRFYRYRTGIGVPSKRDVIHHSFYCPSLELNETIYIDFSCPQTEMNKIYPTPFTPSVRSGTIIKDSSLSGNHGTVTLATTPKWVSGDISYGAMEFDGSHGIDFNNPLNQENLEQEWTVSAWVLLNAHTGTSQALISGWNRGLNLSTASNTPLLYLNSGADDYYTYGTALPTNEWVFITFVFRNSDGYRKIFANGIDITTSGPNKTSTPSGFGTLKIGHNFQGKIDDLRIYAKALSDSEILQIYNERSGQMRFNNSEESTIIMTSGVGKIEIK